MNNPQYGQVETYINGQLTNFSGLYDANTFVKIELTTDLNHLLDSYLGIEASEVQLSSGTEKLYTIEFYLNANRDITLYLDGILLEVIVLNNMTMGQCSFNLSKRNW